MHPSAQITNFMQPYQSHGKQAFKLSILVNAKKIGSWVGWVWKINKSATSSEASSDVII